MRISSTSVRRETCSPCSSAGSVRRDPIPARLLRLVHGEVGELQHLRVPEAVEQGDPDARGDVDRPLAEHRDLPAERLHDALGHDLRLIGVRLGKEHGELVSAHSRQDVGLAHAVPERSRDAPEEIVARLVAEGVVDVLEVVQVDHEHRALGSVARHPLHLAGQLLLEAPPVEEAGQEIVVDQVLEACRQLLALRDVLDLRHEVERLATLISDQRDGQEHPEVMPAGMTVALLDLVARDLAAEEVVEGAFVAVDVLGVRDGVESRRFELLPGMTDDPTESVD